MKQLLYPQEIEVFYLIPAIRREFSFQMKKKGKGQKAIAELLGVTEAAVSQYLNKKRAGIKLDVKVVKEISKSIERIKKPLDSVKETQKILNVIRHSRLICQYHRKFMKGIPQNCAACFKDER